MAARQLENFYRPYISEDEESDSDSYTSEDSGSSLSDDERAGPANVGGLRNDSGVVQTWNTAAKPKSDAQPPMTFNSVAAPIDYNQTKTTFKSQNNTTTIMINSRDRDTSVYGQPTSFSIRLPRVYRNVTSINVTQIKLLSSFYYFSNSKSNTSMRVAEYNRTSTVNGVDVSYAKDIFIREGTYDADTLVTELNNQLNRTPIYNRISISDFIAGFITTGNYGLLFNDPGDTTFNPLTGVFEELASKREIEQRYFQQGTNIGIQYYTTNQCKLAYFYPMLRDYTISQVKVTTKAVVNPFLNICTTFTPSGEKAYPALNYYLDDPKVSAFLNGSDYYDRIVYSFQGLDDPYILALISDTSNQALLEQFKADNTWDNFLVNEYVCSYDATIGRLSIYSKSLNTSLVTTLNAEYQQIFIKELINNGIEPGDVAGIQTTAENLNGVISDMYNFIQSGFTNIFAVGFGTYAAAFYDNSQNELFLYDASGRYGWNTTYTGLPQATTSLVTYPDASGYWSNLKFNTASGETIDGDLYYPSTANRSQDISGIGPLTTTIKPARDGDLTQTIVFTVGTGLHFKVGNNVVIVSNVNSNNRFNAIVTAYSGSNLTVNTLTNVQGNFYEAVQYIIATNDIATSNPVTPPQPLLAGATISMTIGTGYSFKNGNNVLAVSETNQFEGIVSSYSPGAIINITVTDSSGVFGTPAVYTVYANDLSNSAVITITPQLVVNPFTLIKPIVFTIGTGFNFKVGNTVDVVSYENPANRFNGIVTAYNGGNLTVNSFSSVQGNFFEDVRYKITTNSVATSTSITLPQPLVAGTSHSLTIGTGYSFKTGNSVLVISDTTKFEGTVTSYSGGTLVVSVTGVPVGTFGVPKVYTVYLIATTSIATSALVTPPQPLPVGTTVSLTIGTGFSLKPGTPLVAISSTNRIDGFITSYIGNTVTMSVSASTGTFNVSRIYTIYSSVSVLTNSVLVNMFKPGDYIQVRTTALNIGGQPRGSFVGKIASLNGNIATIGSITNIRGDFPGAPTNTTYLFSLYIRYTYTVPVLTDVSGFLDLSGANETTYGFQDISFNILPTSYTKLNFVSRCRQTLFIETIPPFVNEIPAAPALAETYYLDLSNTPLLFGSGGLNNCLLDPVRSDFFLWDISQNLLDGPIYMQQPTPTGQIFLQFIRQQKPTPLPTQIPPSGSLGIFTFRPHLFLQVKHELYPIPTTDTKFKSDIYIEREDSQRFGTELIAYWYRDRAAYMADVASALSNTYYNNPKHWFIKKTIAADVSSAVITTDFISDETSYVMILAPNTNFQALSLRVFVLRHDPYGVYTIPVPTDYRRLPPTRSDDPTFLKTKSTPSTNFPTPYPTLFNSNGFRNSYDLSGVSNNLLDYYILTTDFAHFDPYSFSNTTTVQQTPLRFTFQHRANAIAPPAAVSKWSQYFYQGSPIVIFDTSGQVNYYTPTTAALEIGNNSLPFPGISNEFVFLNWFRAGATLNYYNNSITIPPEQTVAPFPVNNSPWTVISPIRYNSSFTHHKLYSQSPFVACKNVNTITTDISFNDLSGSLSQQQIYLGPDLSGGGYDISGIMGIPFLPPMGKFVLPTRVIIKFSYVQPLTDINRIIQQRSDPLLLTAYKTYIYNSYASPTAYSGGAGLTLWDDKFLQNRRNVVLGVFRSSDLNGKNINTLKITDALCTLSLTKVTQVCQYSSSTDPTVNFSRTRTPDWGTYYVYERVETSSQLWIPVRQDIVNGSLGGPDSDLSGGMITRWSAVTKTPDSGSNIFMKSFSNQTDLTTYYTDVSKNSLCFVPFYAVLSPTETATYDTALPFSKPLTTASSWAVGSFTGLTYTSQPFIPITKASQLAENINVINPATSVAVDPIGNDGIGMGDTSTYLGTCGPVCWGYTNTGLIVSPNYRLGGGFRPTYFNVRVNVRMPDLLFNPMTDLSKFGTAADVSNCLIDTQTYFYNLSKQPGSDFNDISGGWGSEKAIRFTRFDDDSGYNNLSYMPSLFTTKETPFALNVRGYVPTVKFLTGVRIQGKNWIDFGETTISNLVSEIDELIAANIYVLPDGRFNNNAARIAKFYTSNYARALLQFNNLFIGPFTVGRGFTNASYPGETFTSTGFGDFLNRFSAYNDKITTEAQGISNAQAAALEATKAYISSQYSGILPDVVLQRNRYTDPITFSLQFLTQLKSSEFLRNYLNSFDQWGLGWNLGFDKVDTAFTTRHVATTFIRIVEDYIYLKLNDELNINNVDISEKEDLKASRETFGSSRRYYGKLLLNTFGNFAQTFIQPAKSLPVPIGKADKLSFQWVDSYGNKINNNDCEFNVVFEVNELQDTIDTAGTLIKGVKS